MTCVWVSWKWHIKVENTLVIKKLNVKTSHQNESLQDWIPSGMNHFRNESLQEWIPIGKNPFRNETLQEWIPFEMNPFRKESLQERIPSEINPIDNESLHNLNLQKWIPSEINPFRNECLRKCVFTTKKNPFYVYGDNFEGIHKEGIFSDIPRLCPEAVLKYKLMRSAASSSTPSFFAKTFLRSLISASEGRSNSFRSFLSSTRIVT